MWIEVINNYDLQEGNEDWHNVSGLLTRGKSEECIEVVRNGDAWTITIDGLFQFVEIYKGHWRGRWEYKIPYWARGPFKFKTKWSRQQVE